jgi:dihydroorotase
MIESVLFKNIEMVLKTGVHTGDVLVQHGKIAKIGPSLPEHAEVIVKEKGLVLMPGVVDPHVHFRDPGFPHKETIATGSRAAASGGVTSFLDMPNTNPLAVSREEIDRKKAIAAESSLINYGFFIGATTENLDECCKVEQVPGIKIFMGSSTGTLLVDQQTDLEPFFAKTPHLLAIHAEDEAMVLANKKKFEGSSSVFDHTRIRTPEAALKATRRAVELSKKHNKRLHICHLSTQEEADFLREAKPGSLVTTEVSPQHLFLYGQELYERLGTLVQINPPIRGEARHAEALWKALKAGVVDCIATDHAPHTLEEKAQPFGKAHSGMPGVETSFPLMLTLMNQGKCSLEDIVRWMCETPAKLFNMKHKGQISEGYDADLILVDLKAKSVIKNANQHTQVKWSAFDGWATQGLPIATFVHGQMVYREGQFFETIKGKAITFERTSS